MSEVHEWTQWIHKDMILNANKKLHWHPRNKIVNDLKVLGRVAGKGLKKKFKRVKMDVTVSYPALWNADAHNYMPTMKAYVDGMVDIPPAVKGQKRLPAQGILTDDSDAYFSGPYLTGSGERSGRKDYYRFDCRLEVLE